MDKAKILFLFCLPVILFSSGCSTGPGFTVNPKYISSQLNNLQTKKTVPVKLQVRDDETNRKSAVKFPKPFDQILQSEFSKALVLYGYTISDAAPVSLEIAISNFSFKEYLTKIEFFLTLNVVVRENNKMLVQSDFVLSIRT